MIIFDADDPLVVNGTYDQEGYKPGERARIAKARTPRHHYVLDPGFYVDGAGVVRCRFCFGDADHAHTKTDCFEMRRRLMAKRVTTTRPAKTSNKSNGSLRANERGVRRSTPRRELHSASRTERRPTRPRQVPLSGMEDVRIRGLDDCATSISEIREEMNKLRGQETDQLTIALKLMRKHERTTWRAAGVELVRVPGEEKLRVRTSKEKATGETDEEEQPEQGADNGNGTAAEA